MGAQLGDVYMESMLCVCIYTYFEKKIPLPSGNCFKSYTHNCYMIQPPSY